MCLTIRIIDLGSNLDIVKVLIKSAFGEKTLSPVWCSYENTAVEKTRSSHRFAAGPSL